MPELPEVETVCRELEKVALGRSVEKARAHSMKIRIAVPENLNRKLKNRKIVKIARRAKYILIHLDNAHILVIHLGMSGRIRIEAEGQKTLVKHDHLTLSLSDKTDIVFNDPRRFGLIAYLPEKEMIKHNLFAHLGPEPLSKTFNAKYLMENLTKRKTPVKIAIMDQELVVGVGNIYASEALFEAGILPHTLSCNVTTGQAARLVEAIRSVLKKAIKAGGSTLRDYRRTNGDLGYFQHQFSVYDREGKACGKCSCKPALTGGVQKITQGGRSTFYCPRKQI